MFAAIVLYEPPRRATRAELFISIVSRFASLRSKASTYIITHRMRGIGFIVANLVSRITLEFQESGFATYEPSASARSRGKSVYWNISDVNRQAIVLTCYVPSSCLTQRSLHDFRSPYTFCVLATYSLSPRHVFTILSRSIYCLFTIF